MQTHTLSKWATLLLDTGKRNNLINFKDTKVGTVEILCPDLATLFTRAEHSAVFEVYDPKTEEVRKWGEKLEPILKRLAIVFYIGSFIVGLIVAKLATEDLSASASSSGISIPSIS